MTISQFVLLTMFNTSSRQMKSIEATTLFAERKMVGSALKILLLTSVNGILNFSPISSSCHCLVKPPGVIISMRSMIFRINSSFNNKPAIIVFPAPVSSANRKRILGWGSKNLYTASTWWGSGSTTLQLMANRGSN